MVFLIDIISINGNYFSLRHFMGLGSDIKIYNPQNKSEKIYATTIHELTHAAHWNMNRWNFSFCGDRVRESWASGVQWELTRMVYPNYKGGYTNQAKGYTQVVVDMIDTPTDKNNGYDEKTGKDNVTGYGLHN